jgi:diacylglycerol kinase (ATP)
MSIITVYQNPHASGASFEFKPLDLKKYFFRHEIKFRSPSSYSDLVEMVKADRDTGVDCIFSIGGDGTAHTIAQQLIGGNTKLLVLPGGTANDFAEELGTNKNIQKLASVFHARTTKKIDIIKVNDRYLMTNGGMGIAQEVAREVNQYRKSSALFNQALKFAGKNTYSLLFAKQLMLSPYKLYDIFVDSPDFPLLDRKVKSPLILVNNQPKLAGRFPVAPTTRNNDGKFNVTIFTHENKLDFIKCVSIFMRGEFPEKDEKLIHFETDKVEMMSLTNEALNFFGDGENFTPSLELKIGLIPSALEVYSVFEDLNLCGSGMSLDKIPLIQ